MTVYGVKGMHMTIGTLVLLVVGAFIAFGLVPNGETATGLLAGHEITVHKTPTCGCCSGYVAYLRDQGATVSVIEHENLTNERAVRNVPRELESCHFAEVAGYVVEGHVPAPAIVALLAERPDIAGIALPGMPAGSPGMGGTKLETFVIQQFDADGVAAQPFMSM